MSVPYAEQIEIGEGNYAEVCPVCGLAIPLAERKDFESFTGREYADHYEKEQLIDLVFAVGQYNLVSMALNTLGVQAEEGLASLPTRG